MTDNNLDLLKRELIKARDNIDSFPGEFYDGQRVVYDSIILLNLLNQNQTAEVNNPTPTESTSASNIATISKQDIDLTKDAYIIGGVRWINEGFVKRMLLRFVKDLIDKGKLVPTKGNEGFFKSEVSDTTGSEGSNTDQTQQP
jgi:hypothetical protein